MRILPVYMPWYDEICRERNSRLKREELQKIREASDKYFAEHPEEDVLPWEEEDDDEE